MSQWWNEINTYEIVVTCVFCRFFKLSRSWKEWKIIFLSLSVLHSDFRIVKCVSQQKKRNSVPSRLVVSVFRHKSNFFYYFSPLVMLWKRSEAKRIYCHWWLLNCTAAGTTVLSDIQKHKNRWIFSFRIILLFTILITFVFFYSHIYIKIHDHSSRASERSLWLFIVTHLKSSKVCSKFKPMNFFEEIIKIIH